MSTVSKRVREYLKNEQGIAKPHAPHPMAGKPGWVINGRGNRIHLRKAADVGTIAVRPLDEGPEPNVDSG